MANIVDDKDAFSRRRFRELYDFDLYVDHGLFDLVLDNSRYIPAATIAASDQGIQSFHAVLMRTVGPLL